MRQFRWRIIDIHLIFHQRNRETPPRSIRQNTAPEFDNHKDFPLPVAIITKLSLPCRVALITSLLPLAERLITKSRTQHLKCGQIFTNFDTPFKRRVIVNRTCSSCFTMAAQASSKQDQNNLPSEAIHCPSLKAK